MLSQIIKLFILFLMFAVIMVVIVRNKKMKYGRMALGVLLPIMAYILCEVFASVVLPIFLQGDGILGMTIWNTIEWIICSVTCVVSGIMIFKTATKSKDGIITVFKRDYKKWNIVLAVLIVLGATVIIAEGIDYAVHKEEYEKVIMDMFMSANFLDLMSADVLPGNMKLFSVLKKIFGGAVLAGLMVPSIILARKTEAKNDN